MDMKTASITNPSTSPEKPSHRDLDSTPIPQLPQSLKASYQSSWSKLLCCLNKLDLDLTPTPPTSASQDQPSFKLALPNGWTGALILDHAAARQQGSTQPIARAMPAGRRAYEVFLPGSMVPEGLKRESWKSRWHFAIPVGSDGDVEVFEWRRSRGSEVKQIKGTWRGWKLVRLGNGRFPVSKGSEKRVDDDDDLSLSSGESGSGDGSDAFSREEVVAVWASSGRYTSLHDVGELHFLGSGARGELGDRWAVMALMSYMCIWQKAMRDQATAGMTAAATSSTVVVT